MMLGPVFQSVRWRGLAWGLTVVPCSVYILFLRWFVCMNVCECMSVSVCVSLGVNMCEYVSVPVSICLYVNVCECMSVSVCRCVWLCVCLRVHTHVHLPQKIRLAPRDLGLIFRPCSVITERSIQDPAFSKFGFRPGISFSLWPHFPHPPAQVAEWWCCTLQAAVDVVCEAPAHSRWSNLQCLSCSAPPTCPSPLLSLSSNSFPPPGTRRSLLLCP